jgi:putative spermidine/putrescine transport system ATP-binding protein
MQDMATLDLHSISKRFGSVTAVDAVTLAVRDGEFMCILGPSGCGKSTLLRMIAGFEMPTEGEMRIDGEPITHLGANKRPTAMVFQKYTLWPHMTVYDNIAFGLGLRRLDRETIARKVDEALALVSLSGYGSRFPAQLSGGQQQRVALARAIVLEPKILLLDEPFSSLDAILRVRLREELRRIQRRLKITAIFVTHDQEEALTLADRIAVMNAGRVEQLDAPTHIYDNPATLFVADFIGAMNLLRGEVRAGHIALDGLTLAAPDGMGDGAVTVGIRPEDMRLLQGDGHAGAWRATVEQISDLGHYRRALLDTGAAVLKAYLSKQSGVDEGEIVSAQPTRCLVYQGDAPPRVISLG